MNPLISNLVATITKPFIEKKIDEYQAKGKRTVKRPHPAQASTQLAKVGLGAILASIPQIETLEGTLTAITALVINLIFLYKPENK